MNEKKKSRVRIILRILMGILLVIGLAGGWYVSDYSHASKTALQLAENGNDTVSTIRETNGNTTFLPSGEIKCGLIFYPGGKVQTESYAPLLTQLAENGVLCVLLKVPANLAILDLDAAEEIAAQYPEVSRWFVGGHSLGGAASSYFAAEHALELEGVFLLGAYANKDLSATNLKVLCIYGSEDGVLNRDNYEKNRVYLPAGYQEVVIEGGNHAYFGDYGEQKGDGIATITRKTQVHETAEAFMKWIEGEEK